MPPKGIKKETPMISRLSCLSEEYGWACLRRARENEEAIPLIELLYETMHPALELTALRTGPTIETALRRPTSVSNKRKDLFKMSSKWNKRREMSNKVISSCPCPPDMTPAVARSLGLIP